jgi:hypothetical protein
VLQKLHVGYVDLVDTVLNRREECGERWDGSAYSLVPVWTSWAAPILQRGSYFCARRPATRS